MRPVRPSPIVRILASSSFVALVTAQFVACSASPSDGPEGERGGTGSGATGTTGGSGPAAGGVGVGGAAASAGSGVTAGTDSGTGGTTAGSGGDVGTGGTGGDVSASGGTAGSLTGTGGSFAGSTGNAGSSAQGGSGGGVPCQMASYTFAPRIPTVFMLVDQSGSLFDCQDGGALGMDNACADKTKTTWYPLRDGVLTVVQALEAEVRFGFSAFGGEKGDGSCPGMMPVLPDFNNYAAIAELYNGLEPPAKGETPTSQALDRVSEILMMDDPPGDQFILFVTDGQPDYCEDENSLCAPDSVVGKLQTLATAGIKTIVFGLPAPEGTGLGMGFPAILQSFANAGDGQPVARPLNPSANALYDECNFIAGWAADFAATGKPDERGQEIGDYSEMGGTATVYQPDAVNQEALTELLRAALSGVKSCSFDLSNVNGQSIKVDLNKLGEASVAIEGTNLPQDEVNGWSMTSQTQLLLNGSACDTWRSDGVDDIAFNFPCNTIIFE